MKTMLTETHKFIHRKIAYNRRIRILSDKISSLLEPESKVLDIGCGDGIISYNISIKKRLEIHGLEISLRKKTYIPVIKFDGQNIQLPDNSYDYILFIDVLHHTKEPNTLIQEASRVAKKGIIIKDHNCNNKIQYLMLRFTDWFGNFQYNVQLTNNFLSYNQWITLFNEHKFITVKYLTNFGLYPKFTKLFFWKTMDFIAKLKFK